MSWLKKLMPSGIRTGIRTEAGNAGKRRADEDELLHGQLPTTSYQLPAGLHLKAGSWQPVAERNYAVQLRNASARAS